MPIDGHRHNPHSWQSKPILHLLPAAHPTTISSPLRIMDTYTPQDRSSNKLMLYLQDPLAPFGDPLVEPLPHAHKPKSIGELHGLW